MEWLEHLVIENDGRCISVNGWYQGTEYVKTSTDFSDRIDSLYYAWSYVDDQFHGIHQSWHENGQLHYEYIYKHGELNGIQRSWYDNGQMQYEDNWSSDKKNGIHQHWCKNGQLFYKQNYNHGKLYGIQYYYHNGHMEYKSVYAV
jgi:antitoxin component YwqK of YwqJK toxin-antitoxin module